MYVLSLLLRVLCAYGARTMCALLMTPSSCGGVDQYSNRLPRYVAIFEYQRVSVFGSLTRNTLLLATERRRLSASHNLQRQHLGWRYVHDHFVQLQLQLQLWWHE